MRQHLLIDADDTLWENNIYFEQAFAEFVRFLDHSTLSAAEIRRLLDEIELVNIQQNGYGALNFGRNLCQCYRKLVERPLRQPDLDYVMGLATSILEQPPELIDGVRETLEYLGRRHELILFTKGQPDEQEQKLRRSGLSSCFAGTVVVKEKDLAAYRRLITGRRLDRRRTWMVGNSPKSDIKPALAAGLRAVYVPHPRTWHLEREDVPRGHPRLLVVKRFSDLRRHF